MADLSNPTGHVPSYSALPATASDGDVFICDDNSEAFQWSLQSSTWNFLGSSSGSGQTGSTPEAVTTGQPQSAGSAGTDPESIDPYAKWAPGAKTSEYPLTLASTLLEILDYGFQRSAELPDSDAVVEWIDPATISITWPALVDQALTGSHLYLRVQARPTGGASIGIWKSERSVPPYMPPVEPPPETQAAPASEPQPV